MITKINQIKVREGYKDTGLKYVQTAHGGGCLKCREACNGLIGQVDVLALPYTVNEVEEGSCLSNRAK